MKKITFTGERMIPDLNSGKILFYEHLNRYIYSTHYSKGKDVLDIACGEGYGTYLLSQFAESAIGIDISEEAIKHAQRKYIRKGLSYLRQNALEMRLKKKHFDLVVSFEFIEHIENQDQFIQEVKKRLSDNGLFILSTPNKETYPKGNIFHKKELSYMELRNLLEKHFTYVVILDQFYLLSNFIVNENLHRIVSKNLSFLDLGLIGGSCFSADKVSADYFIVICSDKPVDVVQTLVSSPSVENINISEGILEYSHHVVETENSVLKLKQFQQEIKSSRFYKLWKGYRFFRKKLNF